MFVQANHYTPIHSNLKCLALFGVLPIKSMGNYCIFPGDGSSTVAPAFRVDSVSYQLSTQSYDSHDIVPAGCHRDIKTALQLTLTFQLSENFV